MAELEGAALEKALAGVKTGAGTKAVIGKGAGAKAVAGKGAAAAKGTIVGKTALGKTALGKTAIAAKGAGATSGVAKTATGGAFFSGKGLSLGLGLGLGSWGPVILGAIGATLVYAYWKKRRNSYDPSETDAEIKEALG